MPGNSSTGFFTQILNLYVLTLTVSHPHQNVLLEHHRNQKTTCDHLLTLYLIILNVHSIFEKSTTVKSWSKYILCAQIPVKFIKMVADQIASPLTRILSNCKSKQLFPCYVSALSLNVIQCYSITTCALRLFLSIFELLVLRQMCDYFTNTTTGVLNPSVPIAGVTTTTIWISMVASARVVRQSTIPYIGEVTIAVLAHFSKTFDTVSYPTVLSKLRKQSFSKDYLRWVTSYLTGRQQFVQLDDVMSNTTNVSFGVPHGSILGLVLFILHVKDLSETFDPIIACHQYADDTSHYSQCKPADITSCQENLQSNLDKLSFGQVQIPSSSTRRNQNYAFLYYTTFSYPSTR